MIIFGVGDGRLLLASGLLELSPKNYDAMIGLIAHAREDIEGVPQAKRARKR